MLTEHVFLIRQSECAAALAAWCRASGRFLHSFHAAEEFLDAYQPNGPACLVTDIDLPDLSGLDLLVELKNRQMGLPTIVASDSLTIESTVLAMKMGAFDVLQKPVDVKLLECLLDAALERDAATRRRCAHIESLTPRERAVMAALVDGKKTVQIARELAISPSTVEKHRLNLLRKMRVDSVVDLVRSCIPRPRFDIAANRQPANRRWADLD
jgi:two-component system response regulator FixJ